MRMIVYILIFFIFWIICNYIIEKMSRDGSLSEEFIISAVKYRKTIMFDIIALLFFIIIEINSRPRLKMSWSFFLITYYSIIQLAISYT